MRDMIVLHYPFARPSVASPLELQMPSGTRVKPEAVARGFRRADAPARGRGAGFQRWRRPQQQQPQLKCSLFDSLWPKAQRGAPEAAAAPVLHVVPPPPAAAQQALEVVPQTAVPQSVPSMQEAAAAAVSILKSGVVEGMAYTLYSDGSIEAQLPGGTLRFGSITELRNHIEQNS